MNLEIFSNGLTLAEEDTLIELLGKVNPRNMGTRLFDANARINVTPVIEAVCLRLLPGMSIEVYMTQRTKDDTAYSCEYHCPGTAPRSGEEEQDFFNRLAHREFGCNFKSWKLIDMFNNLHEQRGHFLSLIFLCEIELLEEGTETKGRWYSVEKLPEKTVDHHRDPIIPIAVRAFQLAKASA